MLVLRSPLSHCVHAECGHGERLCVQAGQHVIQSPIRAANSTHNPHRTLLIESSSTTTLSCEFESARCRGVFPLLPPFVTPTPCCALPPSCGCSEGASDGPEMKNGMHFVSVGADGHAFCFTCVVRCCCVQQQALKPHVTRHQT